MDLTDNGLNICKIKVVGVGGAGNNAVNRMIDLNISSAQFVSVNTDKQALLLSKAPYENRIQIGEVLTKGLGAGSDPEMGEKAAEESKEAIEEAVKGVDLLFIAAGMGGGTGTGAAPLIARIAKEAGCITVAVVTKPFAFEGRRREENAKRGIANLSKYVDTIVIIPNDKLLEALPNDISMIDALKVADDTLRQGICGIADLISTPAMINLDFADVRTIIKNQGLAHMGVGRAKGEHRVVEAVRQAVSSPLLETTIEGARGVIINVTGGKDLTVGQVCEAARLVQGVVDYSANIIFGADINESLQEEIEITVIATGFATKSLNGDDGGVRKNFVNLMKDDRDAKPKQPQQESRPMRPENYQARNEKPESEQYRREIPKVAQPVEYESEEEVFAANQTPKKELPSFMKKLFGKK